MLDRLYRLLLRVIGVLIVLLDEHLYSFWLYDSMAKQELR